MDIIISLVVITCIYCVLLFFDNFFKTCAHYPYIKFLEGTGFQINFFRIKWQTKAFNRTLIRWGNSKPHFFNLWFNIGLYASVFLLPLAIILLLYSVFQNFSSSKPEEIVVLQPVVPGVNLPASELGYYSGSLVIASVVHELGHALAAVLDDVHIIEVGANILFILPVAYVNLSTDKLFTLEHYKTLRICCAGIWHNLVLFLMAAVVYLLLPILFSICFDVDKGVTITQITKNSLLLGPRGLSSTDVVLRINDCEVLNESSWGECLNNVRKHHLAYCIDAELIHSLDESIPLKYSENGNLDCCNGSKFENICFEHIDNSNGILEIPTHACLPARRVVEQSSNACTGSPNSCPLNQYCFKPMPGNFTFLIKITCKNKVVIYLGHPADIYRTVEVSSYIPKLIFKTSEMPDVITKFTKYVAFISLGLALVNVMPFVYMDGQYIIEILAYLLLRKRLGTKNCKLIVGTITTFFTFLLIFHCIYFFYNSVSIFG